MCIRDRGFIGCLFKLVRGEVVQQVQAVIAVSYTHLLFHRVDDDINVVLGTMLGNLVPGSNTPSVTLLQVGRSPRCIKVMDGDASFLRIHARSEHTCGAEQHSHCPCVHGIYHRLTLSLIHIYFCNSQPTAGMQLSAGRG